MSRELDTKTLDGAAKHFAADFLQPTRSNPSNPKFAPIGGKDYVINSLNNMHFKDEQAYVMQAMRQYMGKATILDFDNATSKIKPKTDVDLKAALEKRLGQDINGKQIPGKLGTVKKDSVVIGFRYTTRRFQWVDGKKISVKSPLLVPRLVKADIHVGETKEEAIIRATALHQSHGEVIYPISQWPSGMMALNTRISNEIALLMCNACVDQLDEGTGAAIIQGRSGAQPTDPDTAVSGTLLFTLVCSDPAFGNAADIAPGARATASAITSDSSADATGTLGYCRASASNDGATALDDHIDGEAGTSGADFNMNTLAIVSGATVALTSWTVTMPES